MIGKKAQGGEHLAFWIIFIPGLIMLSLLSISFIKPGMGGKSSYTIKVEMEDLSNNLFLYGFLRQDFNGKNMADLIALSYTNGNYKTLEEKTIEILEKVQDEVNFIAYVDNGKIFEKCTKKCKGKHEEFTTFLPLPNKGTIKFRLILYE